jgi:hypothetical protein
MLWVYLRALSCAIGFSCLACSSNADDEIDAKRQEIEEIRALAPDDFLEAELQFRAGGSLEVGFETDGGTLQWNAHRHEGVNTKYLEQGESAGSEYDLILDSSGPAWLMWENTGTESVELKVRLRLGAGATWVGWL